MQDLSNNQILEKIIEIETSETLLDTGDTLTLLYNEAKRRELGLDKEALI